MDKEPKGAPPVASSKTKMRQTLDRWSKADTGGDPYDRARGQYSKNPPNKEFGESDEL